MGSLFRGKSLFLTSQDSSKSRITQETFARSKVRKVRLVEDQENGGRPAASLELSHCVRGAVLIAEELLFIAKFAISQWHRLSCARGGACNGESWLMSTETDLSSEMLRQCCECQLWRATLISSQRCEFQATFNASGITHRHADPR